MWAVSAIRQICARLPDEEQKIILQAGDFGVWDHNPYPWMPAYLDALTSVLADTDAQLWFIDGNHEEFPYLRHLRERSEWGKEQGWITARIRWLERGTRWEWNGKTYLALGGAVSVDKNFRTEGTDWFPDEEITGEREAAAIAGGHADILLSHDAPTEVPLFLPPPRPEWLTMIPRAEEHRDRLQRVCMSVRPSVIFHGHYHVQREREFSAKWGHCHAVSLSHDGTQGNWGIFDTTTMGWEW
jgi:hypothetical protein